eukprot:m.16403 g.16403  ORF g.16403 m.16403 type:complete len:287 (+) comp3135_c0_seq1:1784-2644(+)
MNLSSSANKGLVSAILPRDKDLNSPGPGRMLSSKLCLVTGGSSGIGRATAQVLAREGAKVCVTGRNEEVLRAVAAEIGGTYVVADLTEDGACKRVIEEAVSSLGGLTTLVNSAGVLKGGAMGAETTDLGNFMFNFKGNVQSVFELMQHAIPHLRKQKGSSIVNISSVNGLQSFAGCATYCASKAAVDQLTRCAAVDLAKDGIRVNAVNPGVIVTNLQKRGGLNDDQYQAFLQRSVEVTHPLAASRGAVGQPSEVGELIAFLVSDKAGFITGDCIAIDGGRQCLGAR